MCVSVLGYPAHCQGQPAPFFWELTSRRRHWHGAASFPQASSLGESKHRAGEALPGHATKTLKHRPSDVHNLPGASLQLAVPDGETSF